MNEIKTPTTDILLITLNSDMKTSTVNKVSLASDTMVVTTIASDVLPSVESLTQSNDNDVFLAPPPRTPASKLAQVRNVKFSQKTYTKTSTSAHLIIKSRGPSSQVAAVTRISTGSLSINTMPVTVVSAPSSPTTTTATILGPISATPVASAPISQIPREKPTNDNSLLRALIQRPSMKIPSNTLKSIQIPFIRGTGPRTLIRAHNPNTVTVPPRPLTVKARGAFVPAPTSAPNLRIAGDVTTVSAEVLPSITVITTASLLTSRVSSGQYSNTATLVTVPICSISCTTATRTFAQYTATTQRARASTPIFIPFTTGTVTSYPSRSTVCSVPSASLVKNKSAATATITSYTITSTNTPIKLLNAESAESAESEDNSVTDIDHFTRVTYAPKTRESLVVTTPPRTATILSLGTQSTTAGITSYTITTSSAAKTQSDDVHFLEPLPVSEMRVIPATRTFSGPRKLAAALRAAPPNTQRVVIRPANPESPIENITITKPVIAKPTTTAKLIPKSAIAKFVSKTASPKLFKSSTPTLAMKPEPDVPDTALAFAKPMIVSETSFFDTETISSKLLLKPVTATIVTEPTIEKIVPKPIIEKVTKPAASKYVTRSIQKSDTVSNEKVVADLDTELKITRAIEKIVIDENIEIPIRTTEIDRKAAQKAIEHIVAKLGYDTIISKATIQEMVAKLSIDNIETKIAIDKLASGHTSTEKIVIKFPIPTSPNPISITVPVHVSNFVPIPTTDTEQIMQLLKGPLTTRAADDSSELEASDEELTETNQNEESTSAQFPSFSLSLPSIATTPVRTTTTTVHLAPVTSAGSIYPTIESQYRNISKSGTGTSLGTEAGVEQMPENIMVACPVTSALSRISYLSPGTTATITTTHCTIIRTVPFTQVIRNMAPVPTQLPSSVLQSILAPARPPQRTVANPSRFTKSNVPTTK